jgi:Fe-S-cluster formation regulator IscX/YfhJ
MKNYEMTLECLEKFTDDNNYEKRNDPIIRTFNHIEKLNNKEILRNNFGLLAMIIMEIDEFKDELKVNNEKIVAHYTKPKVIKQMLNLKNNGKEAYFRLYEVIYMNDPEEGDVFNKLLKDKNNKLDNLKELTNEDENNSKVKSPTSDDSNDIKKFYTFIGSFIAGNGIKEGIDKLFLWRTYGKDGDNEEAKGVCICIEKEFFDQDADNLSNYHNRLINQKDGKLQNDIIENPDNTEKFCLYWVIYEDEDIKNYDSEKDTNPNRYRYNKLKKEVLKNINKYAECLDLDNKEIKILLNSLLDELRYLVKSKHYKEESECRIIKIYDINQKKKDIKIDEGNPNDELPPRLYIEIEKDFIEHIDEIILGPRLENKEAWKNFLNYHGIKVRESDCHIK